MVPGCLKTSCGLPTLCLAVIAFLPVNVHVTAAQKPHILHVEVADAGWSDVGWNSPEFHTPYLDRLRGQGVALPHFYSQPIGTASRIALLTGRYPYTMGFKSFRGMYFRYSNFSLPLEYKLLPEYLLETGYNTHLSGTWDMGFCSEDYLPQRRGFETFYGSLKGFLNHYRHTPLATSGYDFWDGSEVDWTAQGKYSTTLFSDRAVNIVKEHSSRADDRPLYIFLSFDALHQPIEAPAEFIEKCRDIEDSDRKIRCAMMAAVDDGIDKVITAFTEAEYFDDLLVIFHSSSGGPFNAGSRNYPYRGKKASVYEGGTRVPAFLYGKMLSGATETGTSFVGLLHITDLFPTVLGAAGMPSSGLPNNLDGVDQWNQLTSGGQSARREMVYDVDISTGNGAVRKNKFKLVKFSEFASKKCQGYFDFPVEEGKEKKKSCKEYELYNLDTDPAEERDLSERKPTKLAQLKQQYEAAEARAVPHVVFVNATASFPENNDGVWQPYGCR
ncbi:arylsulfatase I-like [Littorina saxatilis]|uniref:Sulfatase N-terminal domain-containing protein n=1 Tax=Littorina saxatilis TaxID=31220 RepID=A0AAN9BIS7_9CAEN